LPGGGGGQSRVGSERTAPLWKEQEVKFEFVKTATGPPSMNAWGPFPLGVNLKQPGLWGGVMSAARGVSGGGGKKPNILERGIVNARLFGMAKTLLKKSGPQPMQEGVA